MSSRFEPATRKKLKLRLALDGPAGAGKTLTGLRFAFALGKKVAVIDTEHGSASKYQGDAPDGIPFDFQVLELNQHAPTEYTAAIEEAARLGFDVLLIDSLSHAWAGNEGALELVSKKGGNSYTAWKDVTPMHTRMIEAILGAPMHVIATMRSKTEYVLEENEKGKQVPRKIGMAPIQRAGMEYEFDLYGSMDWSHVLTVTKSRCSAVADAIAVKPGATWLEPVIRWLETGVSIKPKELPPMFVSDAQLDRIVGIIAALGKDLTKEKKETFKRYSVEDWSRLTPEQATDYEKRLQGQLDRVKKQTAAPTPTTEANGQAPVMPPCPTPPAATPPLTTPPATFPHAPNPNAPSVPAGLVDHPTLLRLKDARCLLFVAMGINEGDPVNRDQTTKIWLDILAKRGVKTAKELTNAQVEDLIKNINAKVQKLHDAKNGKGDEGVLAGAAAGVNNTTFQ